jgi:hypothetical protein
VCCSDADRKHWTPGNAAATGRYVRIYRPEGGQITEFGSYNGVSQTQFVAPVSGIYYVRIEYYYNYSGEYRVAVSITPGTHGLESEDNNNAGQADGLSFTPALGSQSALMAGVATAGDPGDWFALGFLGDGTQRRWRPPPPSARSVDPRRLNPSSAVVAVGAAGETPVGYHIPGAGGTITAHPREQRVWHARAIHPFDHARRHRRARGHGHHASSRRRDDHNTDGPVQPHLLGGNGSVDRQ